MTDAALIAQPTSPIVETTRAQFWTALLEAFLRDQRSPNTAKAYRASLLDFFASTGQDRTPDQITRSDVIRWKEGMQARRLAAKTINLRITALSALFSWLDDELEDLQAKGMLPESMRHLDEIRNPARKVKRLRPNSTPRRIGFDVLAAVVSHLASDPPQLRSDTAARDLAILELFYATGARRAEVLGIRGTDVVYDAGRLYTDSPDDTCSPYGVRMQVKGGAAMIFEVPVSVAELIDRYLERAGRPRMRELARLEPLGYLFQTVSGRGIVAESFARACKAHAVRAGYRAGDFNLHGIRAEVGQGVDEYADRKQAQRQLGHKSMQTTENYLDGIKGTPCYAFEARRVKLQRAIDAHRSQSAEEELA